MIVLVEEGIMEIRGSVLIIIVDNKEVINEIINNRIEVDKISRINKLRRL